MKNYDPETAENTSPEGVGMSPDLYHISLIDCKINRVAHTWFTKSVDKTAIVLILFSHGWYNVFTDYLFSSQLFYKQIASIN